MPKMSSSTNAEFLDSIFVGVPKIGQSKVNAAKLDIQGVNVLDAAPDQYLMQINSTIETDGTVHADIDPFEGKMYLDDVDNAPAFATVQFPPTNANKHQDVNISQTVKIDDLEAFKQFNIAFFQKQNLTVRISGKTKLQPAGLSRKYDVDFTKYQTLNGLNLLQGTKLKDAKVNLTAQTGENFKGVAEIHNPSHFTLDLGNVTFATFAGGNNVGNLTINNLLLVPDVNNVPISAALNQSLVLKALGQKPACETGIVSMKLLGTEVMNHGKQTPYFLAALGSANQTVDINLSEILGIKPAC
ncbi:hypothetical protein JDV02_007097 [Purpureocillium takamizusanense]|uniref:Uncharacterized protein n=1 Tax=Purpureocillium takamizusanense TaxID=2060973 RepID=A0A9Q8VDR8_9HYPO|nr:uncharacterized protein JDV02_007097 [Purpureocillium takamizusanense]UNI21077.1 hypothetical protein JDV02_007097 [Purpureocillium takamizusanense]